NSLGPRPCHRTARQHLYAKPVPAPECGAPDTQKPAPSWSGLVLAGPGGTSRREAYDVVIIGAIAGRLEGHTATKTAAAASRRGYPVANAPCASGERGRATANRAPPPATLLTLIRP